MNIYILIGPPGCGKSTFSKELIECNPGAQYISSDAVRKLLTGDESNMQHEQRVWQHIRARYEDALERGSSIIFDATNNTPKSRKDFINTAMRFPGANIVGVDCYTGLDINIAKSRNKMRERNVPECVIERMCSAFTPPSLDEGFDEIILVNKHNHV